MLQWRPLRPDELDHEVVWLSVSVGAAIVGAVWVALDLPVPECTWHQVTGFACPSCGATRCVRGILRGDFGTAFAFNPLLFVSFIGVVFYDLYAAWVILRRRPRLRFVEVPAWLGNTARFGLPILL